MKRASRITGIILLVFNGLGALYGGTLLILDSSGKHLGLPLELLSGSPFRDFFWPGLILLIFNGVLSIAIAGSGLARSRLFPTLLLAQGLILAIWLSVQIMMIDYVYFLHHLMAAVAFFMILTAILCARSSSRP